MTTRIVGSRMTVALRIAVMFFFIGQNAYGQDNDSIIDRLSPGQSVVENGYKWSLHAREYSGHRDDRGWTTANSNPKAFSIKFPGPFTYYSSSGLSKGGQFIDSHGLMATSKEYDTFFRVICTKGSAVPATEVVDGQVQYYRSLSTRNNVRRVVHAQFTGQEVTLDWNNTRRYQGQIIAWSDWVCDYGVDYPRDSEKAATLVQEFFRSFRVVD